MVSLHLETFSHRSLSLAVLVATAYSCSTHQLDGYQLSATFSKPAPQPLGSSDCSLLAGSRVQEVVEFSWVGERDLTRVRFTLGTSYIVQQSAPV
jgi:hypothetical protein